MLIAQSFGSLYRDEARGVTTGYRYLTPCYKCRMSVAGSNQVG